MSRRLYCSLMYGGPGKSGPARLPRPQAVSGRVRGAIHALLVFVFFAIMRFPVAAHATELAIPFISVAPGHTVEVPVKIDQIENLAGIKLVLSYDKTALTYVKAVKAEAASSLMHVVNDRKPGQLIIVMAGARGIKGKDVTLMTLTFAVNSTLSESIKQTGIDVKEIQVMDDRLKEVACGTKNGGVRIVREKKAVKPYGGKK